MRVLVIGGGGREHALTWKLRQSAAVGKLYGCPGNPGMAQVAECMYARDTTPAGYLAVAESINADLTIVGPEAPLVAGIVDLFRTIGRAILGPTAAAARLEGSKIFAKDFMNRAGIPTARYVTCEDEASARRSLARFDYPVVLKADGLAAGKGVVVARDRAEAEASLREMFSGRFVGEAGRRVVIEDHLPGEEVSFIVLSDGQAVLALEPTQDHKAIFDNDQGPNTGGMGAYCDSRILTSAQTGRILDTVIEPALSTMRREGTPFSGFLYAGLMFTADGPKLLEFNVRLGDPETQCLTHRLDCDLGVALSAAAHGELGRASLRSRPTPSVCVVMAASGYPSQVRTGSVISGIAEAEATGATVFQAGTRLGPNGLETAGGRVLGVTATGKDLTGAIANVYEAVSRIEFDGMHYRRDIGSKGLKRYNKGRSGDVAQMDRASAS